MSKCVSLPCRKPSRLSPPGAKSGLALVLTATLMAFGPAQARTPTALLSPQHGALPNAATECEVSGANCTWEHVIGGRLDDEAHAVVEMPGGGFALAGHTRSHGVLDRDAWVLRLDRHGKVVWQQVVGGPQTEKVFGVTALPDGGVVIAGKTHSIGAGGSDALIVRFGPDGEMLWQQALGGRGNDESRTVLRTRDGTLIAAGSKSGIADDDAWIIAMDMDTGELLWERRHGTPGEDGAVSAIEAASGGIAIAGYSQRPGLSSFDNWVVRLDSNGDMLWQRHFARGIFSSGTAISAAPEGGFFVAGLSQLRTPRDSKSLVIRLSDDGETLWQRLSSDIGSAEAWGAAPTDDGGVVVVSAAKLGGLGQSDARLVRFSPSGEIIWSRLHGGGKWSRPTAVITTRDGGFLVTGYTTGRGAGYQDVWVLRLDGQGRLNRR